MSNPMPGPESFTSHDARVATDTAELRARVRLAFAGVTVPARIGEMLATGYAGHPAADAIAAAFAGRPWSRLAYAELCAHRGGLLMLSPAAYQACLPAYLDACLTAEPASEPERAALRAALLASLAPAPFHVFTTAARVARLTRGQRGVVRAVIEHVARGSGADDASRVLRTWSRLAT